MDWGGVIAGAMGGGAQAIGQIADNNLRVREQEASEQRRAVLDEERANRAMDRKLQLENDQRDMLSRRMMGQQDQVNDEAIKSRQSKNLGALTDTQAKVGGSAPSASKEELDAMLADPKNRQIYEDAGYIQKVTQSGLVRDRMDAARAIGADPEIRKELKQELDSVQKAETNEASLNAKVKNQEALLEFKRAQLELSEAKTRQEIGIANQRLSFAKEKLENGGGKAENLNGIAANLSTVIKQREALEKDLMMASDEDKPAIQAELKALKERARKFGAEQDRQLDGRAARGSSDEPRKASKPSLPSGVTADAALAQAKAAIKNGKDPVAVKQRLKELGIDTKGL